MDEFFKAFIEAAMKEGMKGASPSPETVKKVDAAQLMKEAAKRTAESTKGLYDAYVAAGFTPGSGDPACEGYSYKQERLR